MGRIATEGLIGCSVRVSGSQEGAVSEKSTRNGVDYYLNSKMARKRSVGVSNAVLRLQNRSWAVMILRSRAEK